MLIIVKKLMFRSDGLHMEEYSIHVEKHSSLDVEGLSSSSEWEPTTVKGMYLSNIPDCRGSAQSTA
jgi:hypothetical protein